jgi:hemerythrin-like domain-containing protein
MTDFQLTTGECNALRQQLLAHHNIQLQLCEELEEIADTLPNVSNTQKVLIICRDILPIVKMAHQFEEKTLFPALTPSQPDDNALSRNLERLRYEHWEDESFAEEICEELKVFVNNPSKAIVDKLSYMLRGFFEGMRRHIAFEVEYLLPKLNQDLKQQLS